VSRRGIAKRIRIAENMAITPANLLGIDLKIAYIGKKYHSGTIEGGVLIGFAGVALSGWLRASGYQNTNIAKAKKNTKTPTRSLKTK